MKREVWKFMLPTSGLTRMPKGAQVLAIQTQNGDPQMWALVDIEAPLVERKFAVYGTGRRIGSNAGQYVGTFQIEGGALVFHVFEDTDHENH